MYLEEIELSHFKNIEAAFCSFSPKLNAVFGGNGMGKTNLLDAVHYLSIVRSHLATIDRMAVQKGFDEALLIGSFRTDRDETDRIALKIRTQGAKQLSRNGRVYKRLSEHIGRFPSVVISPQDYRLIQGGSAERRRFVDRMLSQLDGNYLLTLSRYEQLLIQKSNLLRSDAPDSMLLDILDEQLTEAALFVRSGRKTFIREFTPLFEQLYQSIGNTEEQIGIEYTTQTADQYEEYLAAMRAMRREELQCGFPLYGIQRDDISMLLDTELIRKIGSQGQNKTYLTALKLAEYNLYAQKKDIYPLLLMDDLFDKLDEERVERIIALVSQPHYGQIFITDTNRKYLDAIIARYGMQYCLFKLDSGKVTAL